MVVLLINNIKIWPGSHNAQVLLSWWQERKNKNILFHALHSFLLLFSGQGRSGAGTPTRTEKSTYSLCRPLMALIKYSFTSKVPFSLTHFNAPTLLSNDPVHSLVVFITGISLTWPLLVGHPPLYITYASPKLAERYMAPAAQPVPRARTLMRNLSWKCVGKCFLETEEKGMDVR